MTKTDILNRLSKKDINLIKQSKKNNYTAYPKMGKDGRILASHWKSWQTLQRYSLGFIRGNPESGKFELSELGKEIANEIT